MKFSKDVLNYITSKPENGGLGLTVEGIKKMSISELENLKVIVKYKYEYEDLMNLSTKLLGNSLYGASGNQYFYFFNPKLSDTITAEGRGTIHYMERYLENFFINVFPYDEKLANQFGIKFKSKEELEKLSFIKNREAIVYGDTDSLYTNYGGLFECMTDETRPKTDLEKMAWIVRFNQEFLDEHNKEILKKWINDERHGNSIHNFELETVSLSTINLAKKKYLLAIKWKDGKVFETPKIKAKGIEIVQSSTPQFCRKYLNELSKMLLLKNTEELKATFNAEVGNVRKLFMDAPIESVSCSVNVGDYYKYVDKLTDLMPYFIKGTPVSVQAAGWYNWIIKKTQKQSTHKLIYGGEKIKYYVSHGLRLKSGKFKGQKYFGYPAGGYETWMNEFMPINKVAQFEKTFLTPINRLTAAVGLPKATGDGAVSMELF